MTKAEAIYIAGQRAKELNLPWSFEDVTVRRWRLWPLSGVWRVQARVRSEGAIITMRVFERTGTAEPVRARYPVGGLNENAA